MAQRIQRAWRVLQQDGFAVFLKHVFNKIRNRFQGQSPPSEPVSMSVPEVSYRDWIKTQEPGPDEVARQREIAAGWAYQPLISILTPVYNTEPGLLRAMVDSVLAQSYPNWELCLADGASPRPDLPPTLQEIAALDGRIRLARLGENRGISANTNAALDMARGDFVAFLDHDDLLAPFALFEVVQALNQDDSWDLIYSDHDLLSSDGDRRYQPLFKPDWSPEIMLSANYITHLTVARTRLVQEVGRLDPQTDGAQDWDLFLRISERTQKIAHIPKVLYHWRDAADSTAGDIWAKPYAPPAQLRVISAHLQRLGLAGAEAFFDSSGFIRVRWPFERRKVSIIIPTNGANALLEACVDSILAHTAYPDYEILIVNNGKRLPAEFPYYQQLMRDPRLKVLHYPGSFNFSAVVNFGADHASGDLLLFLNNDTRVTSADWLDELAMWALRPEIGAVGAKLLKDDRAIQHAGVILGLSGFAGHIFGDCPENQWSLFGLAEWYRDYLAVTAACVIMRRETFERSGKFDPTFILCGNDVEFCLRLRRFGLRVVYNPFARLYHLEGATIKGEVPAQDFFISYPYYQPWLAAGDPYFNPNLSYWRMRPTLAAPDDPTPLAFVQQYLENLKGEEKHVIG
jgi:GT2 family glycosyltransferase